MFLDAMRVRGPSLYFFRTWHTADKDDANDPYWRNASDFVLEATMLRKEERDAQYGGDQDTTQRGHAFGQLSALRKAGAIGDEYESEFDKAARIERERKAHMGKALWAKVRMHFHNGKLTRGRGPNPFEVTAKGDFGPSSEQEVLADQKVGFGPSSEHEVLADQKVGFGPSTEQEVWADQKVRAILVPVPSRKCWRIRR